MQWQQILGMGAGVLAFLGMWALRRLTRELPAEENDADDECVIAIPKGQRRSVVINRLAKQGIAAWPASERPGHIAVDIADQGLARHLVTSLGESSGTHRSSPTRPTSVESNE